MTTESEQEYAVLKEQVQRAVSREDRRRRTVLVTFLLLLMIPLAIAAYILARGVTESEWVRETAEAAATSEIEAVRPTLAKVEQIDAALPQIQQAVEALPQQAERIETLQARQTQDVARLEQQWRGEIEQIQPTLSKISKLERALPEIRESIDAIPQQAEQITALAKAQKAQAADIDARLTENVRTVEQMNAKSLRHIEARFEELSVRPRPADEILGQLKEMNARLSEQANDIARIQDRQNKVAGATKEAIGEVQQLRRRLDVVQKRMDEQHEGSKDLTSRIKKLEIKRSGVINHTPPQPPVNLR